MAMPAPQNYLITSAVVLRLISYYISKCKIEKKQRINDEIDEIVLYLKNNFKKVITIEEMSGKVNYTPNYFIKKFKKKTGCSPLQYLNNIRLEVAKFMLRHTNEPVGKIMEKTGFLDASYFSKLFKKNTGYSPIKFRELYLNNPLVPVDDKQDT